MSSTEQVWSVTALIDELAPTKNVVIVTAANSMIDTYGAVLITVFVKGPDFTNKTENGLINPNQCR